MLGLNTISIAALACILTACAQAADRPPPPPTADLPWYEAMLTVGGEPQQRFAGFGFSMTQDGPYGELDEEDRAEVDRLLFAGLDARILRLWYGPGDTEAVHEAYQANGLIDHALAGGVRELLLGPWSYRRNPEAHARTIAEDIRTLRERYGIEITATGVVNEPEGNPEDRKYMPESDYVPLAIAMRRELEALGLSGVIVLGPEFASADGVAIDWFDVVAGDSEALASFDALGTHSYNMAARPELAERTLAHGKQYWMTEAGGGITDGSAEFAYTFATSAGARFLNDLNNGVTHWVWFIGLGDGTDDVRQKLVMCEGPCAGTPRIYKNYAYHYLQQIAASFPPGTTMRHVTSDLPEWRDMVYTYGPKPPINAAAGLRPDGRWALAVVNQTLGTGWEQARWDDPANYRIAFQVPELAGTGSRVFDLCRTNAKVAVRCGESVEVTDGRIDLDLVSLELVTLVARNPAP
jgi:hypothetical protein